MNEKLIFIKHYYNGFKNLFPNLTINEFVKYYDESIYNGYPKEASGSVWSSEGKSIYVLIRILKPNNILEIGNFKGVSTNHILQAVENNKNGNVVLVDIEERLEYNKLHNKNFNRIITDSLLYLNNEINFDLIIQDGNHTTEHVKKELNLILNNNITNNYIIWSHDYFKRNNIQQCGVFIAIDEMRNNFNEFESFKDDVSDCGFSILKKKK